LIKFPDIDSGSLNFNPIQEENQENESLEEQPLPNPVGSLFDDSPSYGDDPYSLYYHFENSIYRYDSQI